MLLSMSTSRICIAPSIEGGPAAGTARGGAPESQAQLATRLSLPLWPSEKVADEQCDFLLFYDNACLSLQQNDQGASGPLCVDFEDATLTYRQRHSRQPEAILKALGAKHGETLRIVDATAGWGLDAFVLAAAGHRVDLFERSVILHALLQDGLRRAAASVDERLAVVAGRMTLHFGDSSPRLKAWGDVHPDVIYLDPMFPERSKSAKVKKNMYLLQQMLHDEPPTETLLRDALSLARRRVVVKRPAHAGFLEDIRPSFQLTGKSSRFDIYLTRNSGAG
ncbi:MAG: class I SAM-dependent methyltransferase [Gammaproteobacteria bacterium]|nr:class I SAM-dependent methyltransferase [Gammaproteobacteria bacterium]